MARPRDPELERVWRQRLQRQSTSGLSISAFLPEKGDITCFLRDLGVLGRTNFAKLPNSLGN